MIYILHTEIDHALSTARWKEYIDMLPLEVFERSQKFIRWQDQHAFVFGRLLLLEGLTKVGIDPGKINELQYNEHGKPFLNEAADFCISHSGKYVICVLATNIRLGADIEVIKNIEFSDYEKVMTKEQWNEIETSSNPLRSFFRLWTMKESVIKAEGLGLSIPLKEINPTHNVVEFRKTIWHLTEISIAKEACAYVASPIPKPDLEMIKFDFY